MNLESGAATLVGRRDNNEDALLTLPSHGVFGVSDGMGGLEAGEVASGMAVAFVERGRTRINAVRQRIETSGSPDDKLKLLDVMGELYNRATAAVHELARRRGGQMGATLTTAVIAGRTALVTHVGDSRCYLVRGGQAWPVTTDHSVADLQLRRGKITEAEYQESPMRHVLYQAIGTQPDVEPDFVEVSLEDNDTLVLCSDGVWDLLTNDQVAQLTAHGTSQDAAKQLVKHALDKGSQDNLTAVVIRVELEPDPTQITVDTYAGLRKSRLFSWMSDDQLRRIAPFLHPRPYSAGQRVVREGEPGDEMYVVLSGEVAVKVGDVELVRLGPGAHFGEIALLLRGPRTATVETTDLTWLVSLHREHFESMQTRSAEIGARLSAELARFLAERVVALTPGG